MVQDYVLLFSCGRVVTGSLLTGREKRSLKYFGTVLGLTGSRAGIEFQLLVGVPGCFDTPGCFLP